MIALKFNRISNDRPGLKSEKPGGAGLIEFVILFGQTAELFRAQRYCVRRGF